MIVFSAILFIYDGSPMMICGKRHSDCFNTASKLIPYDKWNSQCKNSVLQGFLTDENKFLDRCCAAAHAFACKQIEHPQHMLYSEDLWK